MAGDLVVAEAVVVAGHHDRALPLGQLLQGRQEVGAISDRVERGCLGGATLGPALILDPATATLPQQLARADHKEPRSGPLEGREALLMRFHERLLCRVFGRVGVAPDGQQRPQQAWVLGVIELAPTVGHLLTSTSHEEACSFSPARSQLTGAFRPPTLARSCRGRYGRAAHTRRR